MCELNDAPASTFTIFSWPVVLSVFDFLLGIDIPAGTAALRAGPLGLPGSRPAPCQTHPVLLGVSAGSGLCL